VLGDLSIRLNRAEDANIVRLVDLLATYGLDVRVPGSIHRQGEWLDAIATCRYLAAPAVEIADVSLSDHHLLQ
jgi:hypothetical protein